MLLRQEIPFHHIKRTRRCGNGGENSSTNSFSDSYSGPDTEAETDTGEDASFASAEESDVGLDSEAEEILKDIAQARAEGPAKPNHTTHTKKLWKREGELWER
jgi:hypothetical protein